MRVNTLELNTVVVTRYEFVSLVIVELNRGCFLDIHVAGMLNSLALALLEVPTHELVSVNGATHRNQEALVAVEAEILDLGHVIPDSEPHLSLVEVPHNHGCLFILKAALTGRNQVARCAASDRRDFA